MVRLGIIIALIGIIGLSISGLAALRIYDQEIMIERAAVERSIDQHARLVQDRLSERELLARVAVGLFKPSEELRPGALQPLRSSIYAFKADFVAANWIVRVTPQQIPSVLQSLKEGGIAEPVLTTPDNQPANTGQLRDSFDVILDVEPRAPELRRLFGRVVGLSPAIGKVLATAARTRTPVASDPVRLISGDGPYGIILISSVFIEGSDVPAGFLSFSYRIDELMLAHDDPALFSVALTDPRSNGLRQLAIDETGEVEERPLEGGARAALLPTRVVSFGGRDWTLLYSMHPDSAVRAHVVTGTALLIGFALTSIVCGLFGYVAYNNVRLTREIESRISFERRLSAVIGELNHRVKNILAVVQSIVTRTLRSGADIDQARDMLIGRLHAMSNVVSLLSETQWQGVKLKGLLEARAIPNANHLVATGPDLTVSTRAAQSLSLAFYELASNAGDPAFVGNINLIVQWHVAGKGDEATFHLRWEEFNATPGIRREETEFGAILLDRVTPEAVGGSSKRYFTEVSYVYELAAPLASVIDKTEMDRTRAFVVPSSSSFL